MPAEPYLIAHLVRGEPTFDIATRCDDMGTESDPSPWWIIPTSGHRAYPFYHEISGYAAIPLNGLRQDGTDWIISGCWFDWVKKVMIDPNPNWPDHYSHTAAPKGQGLISNLAERLGLVKRAVIKRR